MTQNEFSITASALIRAARQRSNAAIAVHDLAGIAREWMAEVSVLSSTGKHPNLDPAFRGAPIGEVGS